MRITCPIFTNRTFGCWLGVFFIFALSLLLTAPDSATAAPAVSTTIPAAGAINVPTSAAITATFSESMDTTTITAGSVTLSQPLRIKAIAAGPGSTLALRDNGTVIGWGFKGYGQINVPAGLTNVTAIDIGNNHSLALKSDGTVAAWGQNTNGQATVPTGLADVTAIAAGGAFTLALLADKTVVAWGDNSYEQTAIPGGLNEVIAIAAGKTHALAIKTDRTVAAWGDNSFGQTMVPPGISGVTAIAAGLKHSVALKSDGTVVAWGTNDSGQTSVPVGLSGVIAISAALDYTLALKDDGTVVAWGDNSAGQTNVPADLPQIAAIAAGYSHSVALKNDGTVVSWGDNTYGQITLPVNLTGLAAVAAGHSHTLALKNDGTIFSWGYNAYGQTAIPTGLSGISAIAGGLSHSLSLSSSGKVTAWGSNEYGQTTVPTDLGEVIAIAAGENYSLALKNDGTVVTWGPYSIAVPVGLADVTKIAAGANHSLALKQDGTITAWGSNVFSESTIPVGLTGVSAIAAGGHHSVALKDDGTLSAWGENNWGQSTVPSGLTDVSAIAAGFNHTVALKNDGTVVTWGANIFGQSTVPPGLSGVIGIAAGHSYTLAVRNDGTLIGWGDNVNGQTTTPQDPYLQPINATINYSTATDSVILAPDALLPKATTLRATINSGVRALDGTHPAADYSWDFTTTDPAPPVTSASPTGGTYSSAQNVTLTANEPATIYYTTNGSEPTITSSVYSVPIPITTITALKFFARDAAGNSEVPRTEIYNIVADTTPPVTTASPAGGTFSSAQNVTLTANEPATIFYTTNGSTPTISSPTYAGAIAIPATTILKFFGLDAAGNSETVKTAVYILNLDTTTPVTTASPAGGTFTSPQYVTLAANETATIYYTINGSTPTTSSPVYSGPIAVSVTTTLKFFAKDTAGNSEAMRTVTYTIDSTPPATTASPAGGSYSSAQNVTLTANEPATIYYTTNGSDPTISSPSYAVGIVIPATTTLKFFAQDTAGNSETVRIENYTIKLNQIITFNTLPVKTYGESNFTLSASSSSGLPVSYLSSNPAVATISGSTVTIIGAGDTTITASQGGNSAYNPATAVLQPLIVTKALLTIQAADATREYGLANPVFGTTYSGFVNGDTETVLSGKAGLSTTAITTSPVGSYPITAVNGNLTAVNYSFSLTNGTLTVIKANQSITFGTLPTTTYGDPSFALNSNVNSSLAVTYTSSNSAVASVIGSTLTIVGAGTATITASQEGDGNYNAAVAVAQSLTVSKAVANVSLGSLYTTYDGTPKAATAVTVPAGLDVTLTYNGATAAPTAVASYTVVGTVSDPNYQGSASSTLTIAKGNQTITFDALPVKTFGDPAFTPAATASSSLAVTYTSSNSAVASISGSTVTIVGAGTATITASQAGNANYNAAPTVARTLTVDKAVATILFGELSFTYDGNTMPVTVTTVPAGLAVTVTYDGSATPPTEVGKYSVVATVVDANYQGTASATEEISKKSQVISFDPLPEKTYGDAPFTFSASASSKLSLVFEFDPAIVTIIKQGKGYLVTIVGAGTTIVTATQDGNRNYSEAPHVSQTLIVNKAAGTVPLGSLNPTYDGSPKAATATTTPLDSAVTFTYNGSVTPPTAAGSYSVIGTMNTPNYQGSASGTLLIAKAGQTITFIALATSSLGNAPFTLNASTSSGLPVSYTSSNPAVATVSGTTVTIVGVGTTNISANQGGDGNYNAATAVPQTLTVNKGIATVTLSNLNTSYNGTPQTATVTTIPNGLPVTLTYSGSATAPTNAGVYTVIATINSPNYQGSSSGTLTIAKAAQTITFGSLPVKTVGNAPFSLTATSSSGLAVSYTSSNPAVATISGTTVTIVGTGTAIINATQGGDANYNVAGSVAHTLTVNAAQASSGKTTVTIGALTSYFDTVAATLAAISTGSTANVKLQNLTFAEAVNLNINGATISINGGYDSAFTTATGMTTIQGNLVISSGTLIADRLVIM